MRPSGLDLADVATWPWWLKGLAWLGTAAWVLAAGYWLVLGDQRRELTRLARADSDSRLALEAKEAAEGDAAAVHQRHRQIETTLALALRELPVTIDVPALIEDLSGAAVDSGLVIDSIQVSDEEVHGLYAAMPIALAVAGTYHQFGAFIAAAAALERVVAFQDFEIETRGPGLALTLAARAYRAVDGPHRAAADVDSAAGSAAEAAPKGAKAGVRFVYQGVGRSPFEAERPVDQTVVRTETAGKTLASFALARLQMVGVLARSGDAWGLVRDPSGHVHRVGVGDRLGLHGGRIADVEFGGIEVVETLSDEAGGWATRVRRLEPAPAPAEGAADEQQEEPVEETSEEDQ